MSAPAGRRMRDSSTPRALAAGLSRKSNTFQQRMPSTVASACVNRSAEVGRQVGGACPPRAKRSRSAKTSSTSSLQPSRSPRNVTFEPTTAPRSISTGAVRRAMACRKGPRTSRGQHAFSLVACAAPLPRAPPQHGHVSRPRQALACATAGGAGRGLGLGLGLEGLRHRPPCPPIPLHVDAAAEVRSLGNRHPRRRDIAIHRPVVADVDLVGRRDVAGHLALDDDRLGEDLGLDPAVGPDRQDVLPQLDLAVDLAFDDESSLPLSSPLMTTDLPMFTMVFSMGAGGRAAARGVRQSPAGPAERSGRAAEEDWVVHCHRVSTSRTSPGSVVAQGDQQTRCDEATAGPVYATASSWCLAASIAEV